MINALLALFYVILLTDSAALIEDLRAELRAKPQLRADRVTPRSLLSHHHSQTHHPTYP